MSPHAVSSPEASGGKGVSAGWYWDFQNDALKITPAERRLHGLGPRTRRARHRLFRHVHPADSPLLDEELRTLQITGCSLAVEYRVVCPNGETHYLHSRIEPVRDCHGGVIGAKGVSVEQPPPGTKRQRSERHLADAQLAFKLFESTGQGVMITDANSRILSVNPAFTTITGFSREEVVGQTPQLLRSGMHDPEFYRHMRAALVGQGHWQGEVWNRHKSGKVFPEWLTISAIRNRRGRTTHYVGLFSNIAPLKASEAKLKRLAHRDALTGLPNRLALEQELNRRLTQTQEEDLHLAMMFIDLDRFKPINDTLGHAMGDRVLKAVAGRLKQGVRKSDTIARLGGDEFVILMQQPAQPSSLQGLAENLLAKLSAPFQLHGHPLSLAASIGIALYPQDGADAAELLRAADSAMYQAKQLGHNRWQFFSSPPSRHPSLKPQAVLRKALRRRRRILRWRPMLRCAGGTLAGVQIHSSWPNWRPKQAAFAELCDRDLCYRSLYQPPQPAAACQIWLPLYAELESLPRLIGRLGSWMSQCPEPPDLMVEIEIGRILGDTARARCLLEQLRQLGVGICVRGLDELHAPLDLLQQLPVQAVTLSPRLVQALHQPLQASLVRHLLQLCAALKLVSVAEGITTPAQRTQLSRWGCHLFTGGSSAIVGSQRRSEQSSEKTPGQARSAARI